jgi:hypothetical protein
MKYSFAWLYYSREFETWQFSIKRFDTIKEASLAMAYFAEVCLENDVVCTVKLVRIMP